MRILILTSSSNRSGGTRQAMYQARGLAARGHDVTLCLPHDSSFWELHAEPFWHRLPAHKKDWRAAVEDLLPDNPSTPTIVHAFHNKAVKLVAWWGLFWRARNLACVAHRGVLYRPHNPLPYLSPAMRAFIVNSRACAKAISLYTPARKIRLVANAVPDERITPSVPPDDIRRELHLAPGMLCFVYIGNNTPIKGAEPLLRAFAAADLPNARLVMIGTNPDRWNPLGHELGIADRVRHLGHVEQVSNYLQVADAFVFPTSMDSSPNTLLEATRMGLPVVATDVGGVPEIAQGNGILIPPHDGPALTAALVAMADSPERRAAFRRVSQALGTRYSVEARCTALEQVYSSLVTV